jgi:hypothetical protein
LGQEFLQGSTVLQTAAYLGHQFLGNVERQAAPFDATVQDVAGVLFAALTGAAMVRARKDGAG